MFICLFVDPTLGVKKLFEKEGKVEKCGIGFEIKDCHLSYTKRRGWEKFNTELACLSIVFCWQTKVALQISLHL